MHKKAKDVVKEWFDTTEKQTDYIMLGNIYFRPNTSSGVSLEQMKPNDNITNISDEKYAPTIQVIGMITCQHMMNVYTNSKKYPKQS